MGRKVLRPGRIKKSCLRAVQQIHWDNLSQYSHLRVTQTLLLVRLARRNTSFSALGKIEVIVSDVPVVLLSEGKS